MGRKRIKKREPSAEAGIACLGSSSSAMTDDVMLMLGEMGVTCRRSVTAERKNGYIKLDDTPSYSKEYHRIRLTREESLRLRDTLGPVFGSKEKNQALQKLEPAPVNPWQKPRDDHEVSSIVRKDWSGQLGHHSFLANGVSVSNCACSFC